jgi:hypothetical protein
MAGGRKGEELCGIFASGVPVHGPKGMAGPEKKEEENTSGERQGNAV